MKFRLLAIILALVLHARAYDDETEAVVENAEDVQEYATGNDHGSIQEEDVDYGRVELDAKERKMLPILAKLQKKYVGLSEKERQKLIEKADGYREKFSNVLTKIDGPTSTEFGLDVKLLHKILGLEKDTIAEYETAHGDIKEDFEAHYQEEIKEETDDDMEHNYEDPMERKAVPVHDTETEYLRPMEAGEGEYEENVIEHEEYDDRQEVPHLDDLEDQPVYVEDEDEFYKLYRKHLKAQERRLLEKELSFWSGHDSSLDLYRSTGSHMGKSRNRAPSVRELIKDDFVEDQLFLPPVDLHHDVYNPAHLVAPVRGHFNHGGSGRVRQGKAAARVVPRRRYQYHHFDDYAVDREYVGARYVRPEDSKVLRWRDDYADLDGYLVHGSDVDRHAVYPYELGVYPDDRDVYQDDRLFRKFDHW